MKKQWMVLIGIFSLIIGVGLALNTPYLFITKDAWDVTLKATWHTLFVFIFFFSLVKFLTLIRSKKVSIYALLKYAGLALLAFFMSYGLIVYTMTTFVVDDNYFT